MDSLLLARASFHSADPSLTFFNESCLWCSISSERPSLSVESFLVSNCPDSNCHRGEMDTELYHQVKE